MGTPIRYCLLCLFALLGSLHCHKSAGPVSIALYDKPLSVIQQNLTGKWRLLYSKGGLISGTYPAQQHEYLQYGNNRIILGNDAGIIVDTLTVWNRVAWLGGLQDSTYLLSFRYTPGYAFAYNYFVTGIYNDTLQLRDYASDPLYYFYKKY